MGRIAIVVLALLVGCGRIAFDSLVDASLPGPVGNRVFVTSSVQAVASVGGLAGADLVCAARARDAGLAGTFVAYLSTSAIDAPLRLGNARGWYRVDGTPVVDTIDDLVAGRMMLPIRLDETGVDRADTLEFVTTGTFNGQHNQSCSDYTDPLGDANAGLPYYVGGQWANRRPIACGEDSRLYCFQIDHTLPLEVTRVQGRIAFVSSTEFDPASGLAAADAICANEATGLGGTFSAFLPTATAPPTTRFDPNGPLWVRLDGIAVAASSAALFGGVVEAPISITATGAFFGGLVVTGGSPNTFTLSRNCDGWTNAAGGNFFGNANAATHVAFDQSSGACTDPAPIYCLEQ